MDRTERTQAVADQIRRGVYTSGFVLIVGTVWAAGWAKAVNGRMSERYDDQPRRSVVDGFPAPSNVPSAADVGPPDDPP